MSSAQKHIDFITLWQQAMATGLMDGRPFSPHTQQCYRYYVTEFLKRHDNVSFETLRAELVSIPIEHFAKKDEIYRSIISFSKLLIGEGALDKSFLERAKAIRPKRHQEPKRLTVKEADIGKLISVCKRPLDRLIIILLASTGLRASEACSLKLRDIDLQERKIHLYKGKWGKSRRVGITEGLYEALMEYLKLRETLNPNDPLLINQDGQPMDRSGIYKRLQKLGRKAGVQVSPHALRRAFVTINVGNGIPLVYLQLACGHSDIKTTRDYCQTSEDEVIEAMKTRFANFSLTQPPPSPMSDHNAALS